MTTNALHISSLEVRRSRSFTLRIDELSIPKGETTCLVGANGSGKSTLLEAITGITVPNRGTVSVCGLNQNGLDPKVRLKFGYVPDDDNWIIAELTAREHFRLLVSIYRKAGLPDLTETVRLLADRIGFTDFDRQTGTLSHGNRKKVQIIAAMIHSPELLIVDEIRNGLDPVAIKAVEGLLSDAANRGTSVLAATHDLWWAERTAGRIIMLRNGSVVLDERTATIKRTKGSLEICLLELYQENDND